MTPRRREPRVNITRWAERVKPDYVGETACGLWFSLFTWKRGDVAHYAFGWGETEEEALTQGRLQAISTRVAAKRG